MFFYTKNTFYYESAPRQIEVKNEPVIHRGIASYYDYDLREEDQKCRTNDCYSMTHNTCASRDFPRGSILIVYVGNRFTTVRVNDYDPELLTGRIIDLSSAAFNDIAPLRQGLVEVKIRERK